MKFLLGCKMLTVAWELRQNKNLYFSQKALQPTPTPMQHFVHCINLPFCPTNPPKLISACCIERSIQNVPHVPVYSAHNRLLAGWCPPNRRSRLIKKVPAQWWDWTSHMVPNEGKKVEKLKVETLPRAVSLICSRQPACSLRFMFCLAWMK